MITNLREAYSTPEKKMDSFMETMKDEYAFGVNDADREIARQNRLLVKIHGAKEAMRLAEAMWKPGGMKKIRQNYLEAERSGKLSEALAVTAFPAQLRLGVQDLISRKFVTVPTVGDKVRMSVPSNAYIQPYAGTFRLGVPSRVGIGEEFPEANVQGFGQLVENWKFGEIISFQEELIEYDQTGQLQQKVSDLGVNMANYEEIAFAAVLQDTTVTNGGYTFTPNTYTDPDTTTGVYQSSGNRTNRPVTFGAISVGTLKFAKQTLLLMKQPDGQFVNINPNCVVYHPVDEQYVTIIGKSPTFPGTPQTNTAFGAPVGYPAQGVVNPIQGMYTYYECRYLNSNTATNGGAWFVTEAGAPHVTWQELSGLRTVAEAPNSGPGFARMLKRWRTDKIGAMFMYEGGARFLFEGNNGA